MSQLDSKSRKLVYFAGIVVLSIPIIFLGMPSRGADGSGGKLAQLRGEYDLGEATLGKVDPSSATMNLVLLGFRGVASSMLWKQRIEQQENKDWAGVKATTESIILLQPHFLEVWRFQGWNLAFNVSAEWDDVRDRYYWVKEGAKFYKQGTERNSKFPELYWDTARVIGEKVGNSDEKRYFRKYFLNDPDEETFDGNADPDINPNGIDNYLVAQDWYQQANDVENLPGIDQHILMRMIFRSYPARSQFNYAQALQDEGLFNEEGHAAWEKAYDMWTTKFGREVFITPAGGIRLEFTDKDLEELAAEDGVTIDEKQYWTDKYQKNVNYRYWRTLASAESEEDARDAHRNIYDGKQLYRKQKFQQSDQDKERGGGAETWGSLEYFDQGMKQLETLLGDYPDLKNEMAAVEEAMLAVMYWRNIYELRGEAIPKTYPLQDIWEENQGMVPEIQMQFQRENTY
ncbi:MAG: hypothetical protein P8M30_01205 [Planctomycetaceae bacterium]|jgi:hypothetical protein|nr:hypothetical protein [Planctomycetaceae bacterium]